MWEKMSGIYCVRAQNGKYTKDFLEGGYVAIGWLHELDLSSINSRDEIRERYQKYHPEDTSQYKIGQQVGQVARFLLEIKPKDFVITPYFDTEFVRYGILKNEPYQYVKNPQDDCPYKHRRSVEWIGKIPRSAFSIPLQYTLRTPLTVFEIKHKSSFFEAIGRSDLVPKNYVQTIEKNTELVLKRILELDYTEFELLITSLLSALGFDAEHVGKSGDGGIDATGKLDLYNMAKVNLVVQAKRYDLKRKIDSKAVKALRQNIKPFPPQGGVFQGAFITTCDFQRKALEIATEPGHVRIGTINGDQLVDLLAEKWDFIDEDLRRKLGLKRGLVLE